jgi:pyruvate ferredoxin oxidoreductase beta subunit
MASLKELAKRPELLAGGHRMCPGCAEGTIVRQVLLASDKPVIVGSATGCLEVCTTIFPYTAWRMPWIHNAFENVAATMGGVEAAYLALKRRGAVTEDVNFVAFAGDGGTYDIGIQALSGMLERGHRVVYVCINNEAYMNTGIQRSSATPYGAATTTTPVGKRAAGKQQHRKDLTAIIAAHEIPYVAQAVPGRFNDLIAKCEKAYAANGPAFLNVLCPCTRGWQYDAPETMEISRLAVETCFWPLFEVENGEWKVNYKPKEKLPLTVFIEPQGRFRHLLREENKPLLEELQAGVDRQWARLLWLAGEGPRPGGEAQAS